MSRHRLEEVGEEYRAMDERCAIKALLWPYREMHVTRPPLEAPRPGAALRMVRACRSGVPPVMAD